MSDLCHVTNAAALEAGGGWLAAEPFLHCCTERSCHSCWSGGLRGWMGWWWCGFGVGGGGRHGGLGGERGWDGAVPACVWAGAGQAPGLSVCGPPPPSASPPPPPIEGGDKGFRQLCDLGFLVGWDDPDAGADRCWAVFRAVGRVRVGSSDKPSHASPAPMAWRISGWCSPMPPANTKPSTPPSIGRQRTCLPHDAAGEQRPSANRAAVRTAGQQLARVRIFAAEHRAGRCAVVEQIFHC